MASTDAPSSDENDLIESTSALLRLGLPLRPDMRIPADLLDLPSVTARSVNPSLRAARVDGLQRFITDLLHVFEPIDRREAAQALFGLTGRGRSLTDRRRMVTERLDYNLDHFRKNIEPEIVRQMAWLIRRDALQYESRGYDGHPLAASGPSPTITAEQLAERSDTEREILLSHLWSAVYGLRAELLTREKIKQKPGWQQDEALVSKYDHATTQAEWELGTLLTHINDYIEKYGRAILHGQAEFNADALIRLAGWTGDVSKSRARELRLWVASGERPPRIQR